MTTVTKVTYEVVILELQTMRVTDGIGPTFDQEETAARFLQQSQQLIVGCEYKIRKTTVEFI